MKKVKGSRTQLESELCILQRLNHPNITRVLDHELGEDRLLLVLELAEGGLSRRPRGIPKKDAGRQRPHSRGARS